MSNSLETETLLKYIGDNIGLHYEIGAGFLRVYPKKHMVIILQLPYAGTNNDEVLIQKWHFHTNDDGEEEADMCKTVKTLSLARPNSVREVIKTIKASSVRNYKLNY